MAEQRTDAARSADDETWQVLERALGRMRVLAVVVLVFQVLMHRSQSGPEPPPLALLTPVCAGGLAVLGGLTALARRARGSRWGPALAVLGQVAEVLAVVAVVEWASALDPIWVLLVVPVLGGALRFGLRRALYSWALVAALHLTWVLSSADVHDVGFPSLLSAQAARLAVVLLVALPAGYLSEHLLIEVRGLARASASAEERSSLLEVVAESGQRVNDLDSQVFTAALEAAGRLGFGLAELWERQEAGWSPLASLAPTAGPAWPAQLDAAVAAGAPLVVDEASATPAEVVLLGASALAAAVLTPVGGRRVPTVLLAGRGPGEPLHPSQVECLELLARQAGVALRNGELVADLHQARADLEHQAFHDHLTGVPNRAKFMRALERATTEAARSGSDLAVLFCDLDRFKAVNDGLGHDVGNALLVAAVERIARCLRDDAMLARMGGDEFTVLLPGLASRADAQQVADRVCRALTRPFSIAGNEIAISTSVGISYGDRSCSDPGELLRRGDVAMYRSKARGRACWTEWGEELEVATASRLRLERDLRRAVEDGDIDVLFQPVVSVEGRVVGLETLARWQHPQLGLVPPEEFLDIAEESDLIVELGGVVLGRALAVAHRWLAGASDDAFVAVNVSRRQLLTPGFVDQLDAVVEMVGLPAHRLLLEITERAVASEDDPLSVLHELVERGYRLALDDFGQGRASLQHLREFPLTALKLDARLVEDALVDQRVRTILASIIELGRALSLEVVAEGIESPQQAALVASLGCTWMQGFAVAVPLSAAELPPPGSVAAAWLVPAQAET